MALARAESPNAAMALTFLRKLSGKVQQYRTADVQIMGPVPAAMEKKAGRYRAQLVITAKSRRQLAACVRSLIDASDEVPEKRNVRWSVDIDPQDTL
jgi:primosomal protein N' (replication factor Y)